jgi:hypothetical protein
MHQPFKIIIQTKIDELHDLQPVEIRPGDGFTVTVQQWDADQGQLVDSLVVTGYTRRDSHTAYVGVESKRGVLVEAPTEKHWGSEMLTAEERQSIQEVRSKHHDNT